MTTRSNDHRHTTVLLGVAAVGATILTLGVLLLTTWEVPLFRLSTFDPDFTGLACGTPLDNPGWATGSPCHGAVNRQTGVAWLLTLYGLASLTAAIVTLARMRAMGSTNPEPHTSISEGGG